MGKDLFSIQEVALVCQSREGGWPEFQEWAASFPDSAWLLAESPRKVLYGPWQGLPENELAELTNVTVFCPQMELRLEKPWGAPKGWLRLIREDAAGRNYLQRNSSYMERSGGGRLFYGECFQPDDFGFYTAEFGRLLYREGK